MQVKHALQIFRHHIVAERPLQCGYASQFSLGALDAWRWACARDTELTSAFPQHEP